jgi:hypothetical protein
MIILGVDPGLRHTGYAVVDTVSGRCVARGTIVPPGRGRIQPEVVLDYVLRIFDDLVDQHDPAWGAVEQVAWYGSSRRITLPLSHVAGGLAGFLVGRGIPTCLLLAMMRAKVKYHDAWTAHENDAYALAIALRKHLAALAAGDPSALPKRSAVARRIISARRSAHGTH